MPVSALTGQGLDELLVRVEAALTDTMAQMTVCIPYDHSALVDRFHRHGRVASVEYGEQGITVNGLVPQRDAARLAPYRIASGGTVTPGPLPCEERGTGGIIELLSCALRSRAPRPPSAILADQ